MWILLYGGEGSVKEGRSCTVWFRWAEDMWGIQSQWHPRGQDVNVKLYCEVGSSAQILFKMSDFDQPDYS